MPLCKKQRLQLVTQSRTRTGLKQIFIYTQLTYLKISLIYMRRLVEIEAFFIIIIKESHK